MTINLSIKDEFGFKKKQLDWDELFKLKLLLFKLVKDNNDTIKKQIII